MIKLTEKQHQELEETTKEIHVLDPATSMEYVLVKADEYARWQRLLERVRDASEQEAWGDAVEEARSEMSRE